MSAAPILALRKAIVTHLRADTSVTALVPAVRLYGERAPASPTWPFMRYGVSDAVPGYEITVPLHIFSKDPFTDDVNAIAEAIGGSLDGKTLSLADGRSAYLKWESVRVIGDAAEADAWHAIVTVSAMVPRDCATP
jgi:hypothetical protein